MTSIKLSSLLFTALLLAASSCACATEVFLEAEHFKSSGGWTVVDGVRIVTAGKGSVFCCGFLPALSYIKPALDHRNALQKKIEDGTALSASEQAEAALLERSYNPWKFPADLREFILMPARSAKVATPIQCSSALVDAVFMPHGKGILIPLANYTLEPIAGAESATHGAIPFRQISPQTVELPLGNNDFVKLYFQ